MITLKVLGDESADERAERVFSLGVVIGTEDEWVATVEPWLSVSGGAIVHANRFETAEPSKYSELVRVLACSPLVGVAISMDLQGYKAVTPKWDRDTAYCKCFTDLLGHLSAVTRAWNEAAAASLSVEDPVRLEITMDRRQGSGTLVTLYDTFAAQPEWYGSDVLSSKLSFDCLKNPRIQIADLFVRESMKEMDRVISSPEDPPRPAKVAFDAVHKKFQCLQYQREYWDGWADRVAALGEQEGISAAAYVQWLHDTNRVQDGVLADNLKNRFAYLAWLDNKARR